MKLIYTKVWCDVCPEESEEGEQVLIDLGQGPRAIDLCKTHHKELIEPLAHLMLEKGQPLLKKSTSRQSNTGLVCEECGRSDFKNATGLSIHLSAAHGLMSDTPAAVYARKKAAEKRQ